MLGTDVSQTYGICSVRFVAWCCAGALCLESQGDVNAKLQRSTLLAEAAVHALEVEGAVVLVGEILAPQP